jgi:hypothetical protein
MTADRVLASFETAAPSRGEDPLFKQRYDTKYIIPLRQLPEVLAALTADYRVSCFGSLSIQEYESIYFDDPRQSLYQDHQRGKLHRCKIRLRFYPESDFACLEVKLKSNRQATWKWRRTVPSAQFASSRLTASDRCFVEGVVPGPTEPLAASLRVRFTRIALKSKEAGERLSFDWGLAYALPGAETWRQAGDFVVAEVKQSRLAADSPFRRLMREMRIAPASFSKYCYGIYLFFPDKRHNRLKRNYLALERKKSLWRSATPPFMASSPPSP